MLARNPDQTRAKILQAAFDEIYRHGFQGMRVDNVLANAQLTKGALYHHFSNKLSIGYAVVEEIIQQRVISGWIEPLAKIDNPIDALIQICSDEAHTHCMEEIEKGCPLNNLSQEMSAIDEGFRKRIEAIYRNWHQAIADALLKGQKNGTVRESISAENTAKFFICSIQGITGMAKCKKSYTLLIEMGECLKDYLNSLRTQPAHKN